MTFPGKFKAFFALVFAGALSPLQAAGENEKPLLNTVFESRVGSFDDFEYHESVANLFEAYELAAGKAIRPGAKKKVGIKVFTNMGPGLSTPVPLVRAVIGELEKRGYRRSDIYIVDLNRRKMRNAGFLPKHAELAEGADDNFEGSPVLDIESGKYFHSEWFYDNPLMPRFQRPDRDYSYATNTELRKSYLPVPLFLTVDFWINLPMVTDLEGIGISGALGNATIWNMSNNERFFSTPANAPIAVAEVAAIPELYDSLLFTIMTFERMQYVGGPIFNASLTASSREILLSANPVILDYIAFDFINTSRASRGFKPITPLPRIFEYCEQMELGSYDISKMKRVNAGIKR